MTVILQHSNHVSGDYVKLNDDRKQIKKKELTPIDINAYKPIDGPMELNAALNN